MAFTIDTSKYGAGNSNPQTLAYTCGTNSTLLVLGFGISGTASRGLANAPSFGGNTMSIVGASTNTGGEIGGELWYLSNPSTGTSYNISIPNTQSRTLYLFASSYSTSSGYSTDLNSGASFTGTITNPSTRAVITESQEMVIQAIASGAQSKLTQCYPGKMICSSTDMGSFQFGMQYHLPTTVANVSVGFTTVSEDTGLMTAVFRQLAAIPNVPTLFSPTNSSTEISINKVVQWNPAISGAKASSYGLQLSSSTSFITNDVSLVNITDTSSYVIGLSDRTTYYWKVNATDASGSSNYTSPWSFTTTSSWAGILKYYTGSSWQECTSTQLKYYDYNNSIWKKTDPSNFKLYNVIYTGEVWKPIRMKRIP
jgi:hypothetical protein